MTKDTVIKNGDLPASEMTKREMMAMHAMAACRARGTNYFSWGDVAHDAVEIADALLAALEESK